MKNKNFYLLVLIYQLGNLNLVAVYPLCETAMLKRTIRIDEDILEQFRNSLHQIEDMKILINNALRDWLSAKDIKELVRVELQELVLQAFSSHQGGVKLSKSKREEPLAIEEH